MTRFSRTIRSRLFLAGLCTFVLGSGPLLVILLASSLGWTDDPDPNPVGPGILAMLTFWPSIIMMVIAIVRGGRSNNAPGSSGP